MQELWENPQEVDRILALYYWGFLRNVAPVILVLKLHDVQIPQLNA